MRIHLIKNILLNNLEWVKKDLILLLAMIILVKVGVTFYEVPEWIHLALVLFLAVKIILFLSNAFTPAKVNSTDNFSWKFIQGLPLNRHEILFSVALSTLMMSIPLFVWGICFMPMVNDKLLDGDFDLLKVAAHAFIVILITGVSSVSNGIQFPRREFQKLNANKVLLRFIRNALLIITAMFYTGLLLAYLEYNFDINMGHAIVKTINFIFDFVKSWWAVLGLFALLIWNYRWTLRLWENEKISYRSNVWIPKQEYSLMGGSLALLFVAYFNIDFKTPALYYGEAQKLVYQKNYQALESRTDLKAPNKYGVTPMLVAIKEGDLKMVSFLRSRGADFSGKILRKKDRLKGYDAVMLAVKSKNVELLQFLAANNVLLNEFNKDLGRYPIHVASAMCHSEAVDFLLKNGNAVNALNAEGETPIIVAARSNCLSPIVALKEAGGRFDIADKKGKLALDKLPKDYSKELKYFLEKNTRAPASSK